MLFLIEQFNPNHDERGRFSSTEGGKAFRSHAPRVRMALAAGYARTKRGEGHSVSIVTGKSPKTGYMVAYHGSEHTFPAHDFNRGDMAAHIATYHDALHRRGNYHGGWNDGTVYLDVSRRFATQRDARAFAIAHKQKAYYDVERDKSILL